MFETSPEASKADITSTIEAENAAGLVEMVSESDGSRVQPTHHGGVWGFVLYLPNSRHVQHTPQIHNKSWRSGNLHHSAWVEGHTGGSWSIPTVHPCSQNGRRLWVARKHHNLTSTIRINHMCNYHNARGRSTQFVGGHISTLHGKNPPPTSWVPGPT